MSATSESIEVFSPKRGVAFPTQQYPVAFGRHTTQRHFEDSSAPHAGD